MSIDWTLMTLMKMNMSPWPIFDIELKVQIMSIVK